MEFNFNERPIVVMAVLQKAASIYRKRFQFFISVSLVYAILNELTGLGLRQIGLSTEEVIFYRGFVNIFIVSWASIAIIFGAARLARGKSFLTARALSVARERYINYLIVYLTPLTVIGLGSVLLVAFFESFLAFIFPIFIMLCFYYLTLFLFADVLVVTQRLNFFQAFMTSSRLVRPFFWKVFTYLLIMIGLSLVPQVVHDLAGQIYAPMAPGVQSAVMVVVLPFLLIAQVVLLHEVRSRIERNIMSLEDQIESLKKNE